MGLFGSDTTNSSEDPASLLGGAGNVSSSEFLDMANW